MSAALETAIHFLRGMEAAQKEGLAASVSAKMREARLAAARDHVLAAVRAASEAGMDDREILDLVAGLLRRRRRRSAV